MSDLIQTYSAQKRRQREDSEVNTLKDSPEHNLQMHLKEPRTSLLRSDKKELTHNPKNLEGLPTFNLESLEAKKPSLLSKSSQKSERQRAFTMTTAFLKMSRGPSFGLDKIYAKQ